MTNSGVRPITTSKNYGAIAAEGSAAAAYTFVSTAVSGATITAELTLQDTTNTGLGPIFYTFQLPFTRGFTNSEEIFIPYIGPASPYPSSIDISGLANGLLVSKVTATLNGFAHSWPHDVAAVLVDPAGQEVVLMEHTGSYYNVTNLTLTFDDAATQSLPQNSALSSGTFLTTEYTPFDVFPGLAVVPPGNTNLAVFNGANPNGLWSLYVYDDTQGNDGYIVGGWSLNLTLISPLVQPISLAAGRMPGQLLQLNVVGSPSQDYGIQVSSNLVTWTTIATNTGNFTFIDSLTNAPQRYYRVIQLP